MSITLRKETNLYDDQAIAKMQTTLNNKIVSTYGTCTTAAATAAKVVTLADFTLFKGAQISVLFSYSNTAASPTLNVNNTGAKAIWARGAELSSQYYWSAKSLVKFTYDGSHWVMENAESQDEVFNRLTNGGATQGIYLSGGKLYINATYIATGTLKDADSNVVFNLSTGTLTMKKGSINIGDGAFSVTSAGALTATNATITGKITSTSGTIGGFTIGSNNIHNGMTSLTDTTNNGVWIGTNGIALGKGAFKVTSAGALTATNATITGKVTASSGSIGNFTISDGAMIGSGSSSEVVLRPGQQVSGTDTSHLYGIFCKGSGRIIQIYGGTILFHGTSDESKARAGSNEVGYFQASSHELELRLKKVSNDCAFTLSDEGSEVYQYASSLGYIRFTKAVRCSSGLTVSGTKSRRVETNDYGDRLLYCYETPSPLFGDVGEGIVGDDGKCYIQIDSILAETINLSQYQVSLQKYGFGDCWVSERNTSYFIVEGDPGLPFGWELKAKQSGFDQFRLEKDVGELIADNGIDYGTLLEEHIRDIQAQREEVLAA